MKIPDFRFALAAGLALFLGGLREAQVTQPSGLSLPVAKELPPGKVWLVPHSGPRVLQPNIQAAVDAASDGDTVLLSAGRFAGAGNRDVTVTLKNIRIVGDRIRGSAVLDCENKGRGFLFLGQEVGPQTVLSGVRVTNGYATTFGGELSASMGVAQQ